METKKTEPQGLIWVCDVCMFARENGVDLRLDSDGGNPDDPEPWSAWYADGTDLEVAYGLLTEDHSDGCTVEDRDEGCDCGTDEYSTSSCDGCDQWLHGRRTAYTWWK